MSYPELVYKSGASARNVIFGRQGDNLATTGNATGARVVFEDWFRDGWLVQEIHLAGEDGTILRREQIDEVMANHGLVPDGLVAYGGGLLEGTAYADHLFANAYGTTLSGGGGNDELVAEVARAIFGVVFDGGEGNAARGSRAATPTTSCGPTWTAASSA